MTRFSPSRSRLLFDVMSTIAYDPFYEDIPRFFGLTLQELFQVKHPSAWVEFELNNIDETTFLAKFFRDGRDYDREGLKDCFRNGYRFLPGMEELLGDLHAAGWQLHLFSNYTVWYSFIEERLGLSRFASWSCVSCHLGARKPAAEAYQAALRRVGAEAADCVFIDDRADNCSAAEGEGIRSVRFQDSVQLRETLAAWSIR